MNRLNTSDIPVTLGLKYSCALCLVFLSSVVFFFFFLT